MKLSQTSEKHKFKSPPLRAFFVLSGVILVVLGTIGLFLPLLPSVKFFVLAAFCFIRGSEKIYRWLINHRWYGPIIANFKDEKRLSLKTKIAIIIIKFIIAATLGVFIFTSTISRILIFLLAIVIGIFVLRIPSKQSSSDS